MAVHPTGISGPWHVEPDLCRCDFAWVTVEGVVRAVPVVVRPGCPEHDVHGLEEDPHPHRPDD